MKTPDATPLWDLYGEWKSLTENEGQAILSSDWVEVRRCQQAKERLRARIVKLTDSVQRGFPSPAEQAEINIRIRQHVNELILLETENHSLLGRRMAKVQEEQAALDQTSNRLRKIHKSYAPSQMPVWNQYS